MVNVLNAAEVFTLKLLILRCVNFTSMNFNIHIYFLKGLLLYMHTILDLYLTSYYLFLQICLEPSSVWRWEPGPHFSGLRPHLEAVAR